MSKYKEIVYMVLDELKASADDAFFTEDHVIFLANKYRTFLLKQKYADIKKQIPESNYQTICLDLVETPALEELLCEGTMLRSKEKIPYLMKIGNPVIYPINYFKGNITYVSRDRMKYVGENRYLQNIIYASLAPDQYLWFTSRNPQYLYMEKVRFTAIFEDPTKAWKLACDGLGKTCDILEAEYPLEEALIPMVIELIMKELLGANYRPKDNDNNADDDLTKNPQPAPNSNVSN